MAATLFVIAWQYGVAAMDRGQDQGNQPGAVDPARLVLLVHGRVRRTLRPARPARQTQPTPSPQRAGNDRRRCRVITGVLALLAVLALAFARVPLGFSMLIVSWVGLGLMNGWDSANTQVPLTITEAVFSYDLAVMPRCSS